MRKHKNKKIFKNLLIVALLSFFLLLSSGCLFSSSLPKGSVEGYVYEKTIIDTTIPLEGALVSITGSSNIALTDTDGYFRIDEVSIGARTLTITKKGYIAKKLVIVIKENEITLADDGNPIIVSAVDDKFLFDGGVIYYNSGDYSNAITTFQQLINEFPDSPYADDAQYYIAYINEKKFGYYSKALLEYYELLINYPDSIWADDAQLGMGNCYYASGEYNNAIVEYQKVINDYPNSPFHGYAQYYIGHSCRRLYDFEQAVIEFNKVIENYPESDYSAPAQYYIGYSYYEAQDYIQAIIEFQKVIINYPDDIWPDGQNRLVAPCAQYYIGWCYGQKLGQWGNAIPAFQLVIDNYPNSTWSNGPEIPPDAQYQIGWCYEQLEQWSDAIIAYQKVIDNYPNSTWGGGSSIPADAQSRIDWINENHPPS